MTPAGTPRSSCASKSTCGAWLAVRAGVQGPRPRSANVKRRTHRPIAWVRSHCCMPRACRIAPCPCSPLPPPPCCVPTAHGRTVHGSAVPINALHIAAAAACMTPVHGMHAATSASAAGRHRPHRFASAWIMRSSPHHSRCVDGGVPSPSVTSCPQPFHSPRPPGHMPYAPRRDAGITSTADRVESRLRELGARAQDPQVTRWRAYAG